MCFDNECTCGKKGKITRVLSKVPFEFSKPYPAGSSLLHKEYLNEFANGNYERSVTVLTKYGMVLIQEMKWETNFGWDNFSVFTTIINGFTHRAYLKTTKMSDWQLKHKAHQFMKLISTNN